MTTTPRSGPAPGAIIGAVALLAVVAGVLAFLLLSGGGDPVPSAEPSASASASATPVPTEEALNEELLTSRLTVMLVGLDATEARDAQGATVNSDALLLVSISADQSEVTMISLPRDTVDVPLPGGGTVDGKINGVYATAGIDTLVDAMAELYGLEIDGHVVLDMDDFVAVVEAVEGVRVDPNEPLSDPPIDLELQPGEQELDPETALSYVRTRVDQDYGRMARQQEVLWELVGRLVADDREVDLAELAANLDSLETNLPLDELPTLVEIARRAEGATVTNLVIGPPDLITFEGDRGDGRGYVLEADSAAIRERVAELIPGEE